MRAIFAVAGLMALAGSGTAALATAPKPAMIPARQLDCDLGHLVNFDPARAQTAAELRFDSRHNFRLALPAIRARTTPPPEAYDKPEPVNPRTRILADPDHVAAQGKPGFERVIDMWPERVELTAPIKGDLNNVIVITPGAAPGTASLFMMRASELTHFDRDHLYQGSCQVRLAGQR